MFSERLDTAAPACPSCLKTTSPTPRRACHAIAVCRAADRRGPAGRSGLTSLGLPERPRGPNTGAGVQVELRGAAGSPLRPGGESSAADSWVWTTLPSAAGTILLAGALALGLTRGK